MVKSNSHVIEISSSSPPSPPTPPSPSGVAKVYGDASSPEYAELNLASPSPGGRIDNHPSTWRRFTGESIVGGGNPVEMAGTGRVAMWSRDGRPWGNVEHTFYLKILEGPTSGTSGDSARILQPYIGGGHHHTDSAYSGEGNAYKLSIMGGGVIVFRKELFHRSGCGYCGDRRGTWHGPVRNFVPGFRRWYGFKQVQLLLPDRNRQEVYIDEGAEV